MFARGSKEKGETEKKREGGRLRGTAELNTVPGQSNQAKRFHVLSLPAPHRKETQVTKVILLCSQKLNMLRSQDNHMLI